MAMDFSAFGSSTKKKEKKKSKLDFSAFGISKKVEPTEQKETFSSSATSLKDLASQWNKSEGAKQVTIPPILNLGDGFKARNEAYWGKENIETPRISKSSEELDAMAKEQGINRRNIFGVLKWELDHPASKFLGGIEEQPQKFVKAKTGFLGLYKPFTPTIKLSPSERQGGNVEFENKVYQAYSSGELTQGQALVLIKEFKDKKDNTGIFDTTKEATKLAWNGFKEKLKQNTVARLPESVAETIFPVIAEIKNMPSNEPLLQQSTAEQNMAILKEVPKAGLEVGQQVVKYVAGLPIEFTLQMWDSISRLTGGKGVDEVNIPLLGKYKPFGQEMNKTLDENKKLAQSLGVKDETAASILGLGKTILIDNTLRALANSGTYAKIGTTGGKLATYKKVYEFNDIPVSDMKSYKSPKLEEMLLGKQKSVETFIKDKNGDIGIAKATIQNGKGKIELYAPRNLKGKSPGLLGQSAEPVSGVPAILQQVGQTPQIQQMPPVILKPAATTPTPSQKPKTAPTEVLKPKTTKVSTEPKTTQIEPKSDLSTSISKAKSEGKYNMTINIQDKNDLDYLRRIFSEDTISNIKAGKKTDWRGNSYEDLAKINIISETPKTIAQQLEGKIKDVKLKNDTFYHGTSAENADSIMSSNFKVGSKLPEEIFRGGGYGKMQNSISLAETPKEASIFSDLTRNGKIIEVRLKPNSKVVSIDGIEDANDLDDYISYLKKQKIDAVYIGGGEKELVIINEKSIIPTKSQLKSEWDKVEVKPKETELKYEPVKETIRETPTIIETKVGKSIEQKAVDKGILSGLEEVAEYNATTIKEQEAFFDKFIKETPKENVLQIVRGNEPIPEGLKGASLLVGLENYAVKNGDAEMLLELAKSPLATETSEAGQTLRLIRERKRDSVAAQIYRLKKARDARAKRQLKDRGKSDTKVKENIKKSIKEKIKETKITKSEWENFISEIRC